MVPPLIATAFEFCSAIEPSARLLRAAAISVRSDKLLALVNLVAMLVVKVLAMLASLPNAVAISTKVSSAAGAAPMTAVMAA